jgi:hypothetical protein
MFLDTIHRLVFCLKSRPVCILKHNVSETGLYLRPQVKPTLLGSIDRASPHLRTFVSLKNEVCKPCISYRKYKESARMSLLDHPISIPSLDISPI